MESKKECVTKYLKPLFSVLDTTVVDVRLERRGFGSCLIVTYKNGDEHSVYIDNNEQFVALCYSAEIFLQFARYRSNDEWIVEIQALGIELKTMFNQFSDEIKSYLSKICQK